MNEGDSMRILAGKKKLVRHGQHCGNLGNENMFYDNMTKDKKDMPSLADAHKR